MPNSLKNLLLSAVLIAVPAAGFTVFELALPPSGRAEASQPSPGLGDLSSYQAIVSDTQAIASKGDLGAAEQRITDLETLWDDNAAALRKKDPAAWGAVDGAADAAFAALRSRAPDPSKVEATLASLSDTLEHPVPSAGGARETAFGIAVTDISGHPLPCEEMTGKLRDAFAGISPTQSMLDLQSKALERCNADDDVRADAFAAQALSLVKG